MRMDIVCHRCQQSQNPRVYNRQKLSLVHEKVSSVRSLHLGPFLPLDEAIASRAVSVIVSGSDGRADGRKRFWSQLNNSKR